MPRKPPDVFHLIIEEIGYAECNINLDVDWSTGFGYLMLAGICTAVCLQLGGGIAASKDACF